MSNEMIVQTLPLTQGQQLMWTGQRLRPDVPLYNMIFTFTLHGALDTVAFRQAFEAFVAASDTLRTVMREQDGTPYQMILASIAQPLEEIDLSAETNPQAAYERWLEKRRARPFDLTQRTFDSILLTLADDEYVWYFNQHHTLTDAQSARVIFERVSALYQQAADGDTLTPPDLPSYSDVIAHERDARESEAYAQHEAYWQEQLSQPAEPMRFYGSHEGSLSSRTERLPVPLGEERHTALAAFAQEKGIRSFSENLTYANIFSALVLAFMARLSGNEALRLGVPFANRSTPQFQQTTGLFIEVLSLTVDVAPDETFRSLVKKVAAQNLQALQHLQPGLGTAAHNRAYDVLLNMITTTFPDFAGIPTTTDWVHSGYGDDNHKLRVQVHDMNDTGQRGVYFDVNTAAFNSAEREWLIAHFLRVMDACLTTPDALLREIVLLTDDEAERYLVDFNMTVADYPADKTVVDLIEAQVERTPQAIAAASDESSLTYAELNTAANQLAARLQSQGVTAGARIPVCFDHSFEMVVSVLAILKAGAAYLPIDPAYPAERVRFILDDIGAVPLLLTQAHYRNRFAIADAPVLTIEMQQFTDAATPNPTRAATPDDLAYIIYTSGSTGKPKGVRVPHAGLTNYLCWAREQYTDDQPTTFALYSSLAFDLTVTSLYVPLLCGGTVRLYPDTGTRGMVIREVFTDDAVDVVKLTPSHLALIRDMDLSQTRVRALILGGEDFKTELAQAIHRRSNGDVALYNEYGPTEATVACLLHRYQPQDDIRASVPIGSPADNMRVYVLDDHLQPTPTGVIGEIYISGVGVADGYLNRPALTQERFLRDPFGGNNRMYKTGDLARWLPSGQLEFLGRADRQVKVGGARIELGEVESALLSHPAIHSAAATVRSVQAPAEPTDADDLMHCQRCGLASDFPGVTFDDEGVCSVCRSYDTYKQNAQQYFKDMDDLRDLVSDIKAQSKGEYDCVALVSGGKDSSYMLYRLAELDLNVLAFTLDNGYISDEAKANIRRITQTLNVDHIFGETPFMDSIFVDSLRRYANVCNGCFKTLYTLAVNLAREKGIGTIVTGLSRGQFFETRLTEELFEADDFDVSAIDESIARARKAYHQRDDIISRSLDVDVFRDETLYEDVQFVDFYRYCDVDLDDVYAFLDDHAPWVRPSDTGRSTNCLINDVGIYVHKKRRGFHNYALPYSWDVRMGHKTREEAMQELDDDIDETRVKRIMREIGYHDPLDAAADNQRLVAYYVADDDLNASELREHLQTQLPDYMLPSHFVALDTLPLNANGKVNFAALPPVDDSRAAVATAYVEPRNEVEETLAALWQTVLHMERVGVHDDFFDLGGHSLPAIRIATRVESLYEIDLPLDVFFANPTVAQLATAVEDIIMSELDALSDDEVLRLLDEDNA